MAKIGLIREVAIADLVPYERNAKTHSQEQVEKIANSIKEFGFLNPCLIDKDNNLIAGHGRVEACKLLGWQTVPCLPVEGLTEAQRRAYILADNKLTELGGWDMELVNAELTALQDMDFDIDLTGFEIELEEPQEVKEDNFDIDAPIEPVSKLGDVWKLGGGHRLMCGDSTSITDIERLMDGNKADLVFTDPPYLLETKGGCKGEIGKALRKQGNDIEFISNFNPQEFLDVLPTVFDKNKINAYAFCNKDLLPQYLNWAVSNKYSYNVLVWKKPNAIPIGDSHRPDIEYLLLFRKNAIWNNAVEGVNYSRCLEFSRETGLHPTMKPIGLIANELKISSNKNSIVLDLFGGSGSTLIACEQLDRKCYMMELDPHYVDVIINRWETLTGKKAKLINK